MSPIIGCCIFVNNMNVEETHLTRAREAKHFSIPMEVSANLTFLCIWIPPCDHYPATPYYSGRCLPCCNDPMYFGFVGYCNWGVCRPAHIRPHLVQEIMTDTYNPPPFLQQHARSTVNRSLRPPHVRGGFWRGIPRRYHKAYLKYSLDISVPYWYLDRKVSHQITSQARTSSRLEFLPTVAFRDINPPLPPIQPPLPPRLTSLYHRTGM